MTETLVSTLTGQVPPIVQLREVLEIAALTAPLNGRNFTLENPLDRSVYDRG